MNNNILEGLSISIIGISVTFAALGLLILAMIVSERAFRKQPLVSGEDEPEEAPIASTLEHDTEDEEVAAAIAVALAHLRSPEIGRNGLGMALEDGHGPWWVMGQLQQRSVNTLPPLRASLPPGTLHKP